MARVSLRSLLTMLIPTPGLPTLAVLWQTCEESKDFTFRPTNNTLKRWGCTSWKLVSKTSSRSEEFGILGTNSYLFITCDTRLPFCSNKFRHIKGKSDLQKKILWFLQRFEKHFPYHKKMLWAHRVISNLQTKLTFLLAKLPQTHRGFSRWELRPVFPSIAVSRARWPGWPPLQVDQQVFPMKKIKSPNGSKN